MSANAPAISTIIPTYNRAALLPRAVDSVLAQMEPADELIIVDDGSTDDTPAVAARYGERVKYIRTQNGGCGAARNAGVKIATRPLVAFLDSDDEWLPEHNLVLRSVMAARPDLLFGFSNFTTKYNDGKVRRFSLESQHGRELNWEDIIGPAAKLSSFMTLPNGLPDYPCHETNNLYRSLCNASYVSACTLIVRREQAGAALWFSDNTKVGEEVECGARLAAAGKGLYVHCETTLVHHHSAEQLIDSSGFVLASSRIVIMRRIWGVDQDFLRENRPYFEQKLREQQIIRVGGLLVRGQCRQARLELPEVANPPRSYVILSRLPGWVTKGLLDLRRFAKSLISKPLRR